MNRCSYFGTNIAVLVALILNVALAASALAEPAKAKPAESDSGTAIKSTQTPITVTGMAVDHKGWPIEGATIFLVATNGSPQKKTAQATTDKEGRYVFRDFRLPINLTRIRAPNLPPEGYEEGTFQVFGKASGRGFAWLGMKTMFVDPRFIGPDGKTTVMEPQHGFFPGERIVLKLQFSSPKPIAGRFVDESGKPIADMKLKIESCDYTDVTGMERNESFRDFAAIQQASSLMPDQLTATTDADGRFSFDSVPPNVVCSISARHADFGARTFNATTSEPTPAEHKGEKVLPLPISMTMARTRTIAAIVRFADTGEPAPGALLTAYKQLGVGTRARGYADKEGKVTLKLPPDEYTLSAIPPKETDYVETMSKLVVRATDDKQSLDVELDLGGVLILEAVDLATGKPIADVNFWFKDDNYPWNGSGKREPGKRWFVQSNTTTNDFPKTDDKGVVRAVIYPGSRLYGVGLNPLPDGYKAQPEDQINGRTIDVPAGTTVSVPFFLEK